MIHRNHWNFKIPTCNNTPLMTVFKWQLKWKICALSPQVTALFVRWCNVSDVASTHKQRRVRSRGPPCAESRSFRRNVVFAAGNCGGPLVLNNKTPGGWDGYRLRVHTRWPTPPPPCSCSATFKLGRPQKTRPAVGLLCFRAWCIAAPDS